MKTPYSLPDDNLKDYAEKHLQYEVDMLTWSAGILAFLAKQNNAGQLPWAINNGLLNTFAVHARNLIYFLYSRSKGKDYSTDLILQDYVDESDISSHLTPISPLLEEALIKANKQVAHLSMERIDYETTGKHWKFIEVTEHIRQSFASIIPYIPALKMNSELREKLSIPNVTIPVVDITMKNAPNGHPIGVCFSLRLK
jgi:hypothetical protein